MLTAPEPIELFAKKLDLFASGVKLEYSLTGCLLIIIIIIIIII